MGSGASKKKGAKDAVHVASTVSTQADEAWDEAEEEQTREQARAQASAVQASPPATPMPEKPKAQAEVKRPQRKKGSKGQASDEDMPSCSPSPSPSPAPQEPTASSTSLPMPPRLPGASGGPPSPTKARSPLAQDASNEGEVAAVGRQTSPAEVAPCQTAPEQPPSPGVRVVKPEELAAACRQGDAATVEAFLAASCQIGAKGLSETPEALFDPYGDSVLHHAVHGGSLRVVQSLLGLGRILVDIPNARNETALQIACRRGHADIVATLLEQKADPDRRDGNGLTPFLSAVFAGAGEATMDLLIQANANVGVQDDRGISSLHFASLRGDAKLIQWLLQHQATVDLQTEHGTTALMLAARKGHLDCVSLLLEGQASTVLTDEAGCTALMHALSAAHSDAAKKILETTSSIETVDCTGEIPSVPSLNSFRMMTSLRNQRAPQVEAASGLAMASEVELHMSE